MPSSISLSSSVPGARRPCCRSSAAPGCLTSARSASRRSAASRCEGARSASSARRYTSRNCVLLAAAPVSCLGCARRGLGGTRIQETQETRDHEDRKDRAVGGLSFCLPEGGVGPEPEARGGAKTCSASLIVPSCTVPRSVRLPTLAYGARSSLACPAAHQAAVEKAANCPACLRPVACLAPRQKVLRQPRPARGGHIIIYK